jgi:hypothetical protein
VNFILGVLLALLFAAVWTGFAIEVGVWLKGKSTDAGSLLDDHELDRE